MATKRPVSMQKISTEKQAPGSGSEQAAAAKDGLPSGVGIEGNDTSASGATNTDTGGKSKEETLAESTTPRQQVAPAFGGGDELPEARAGATVGDVADKDAGSPGPDSALPAREELEQKFFDEVTGPVGAGQDDSPDDSESTNGSGLPGRGSLKGDFPDSSEGTGAPSDEVPDGRFGSKESMIGQDRGISGAAPVHSTDEGVSSGPGLKKLAEDYKGGWLEDVANGMNSANIGAAGAQLAQIGKDVESTHTSKDGVVTKTTTVDGTVIIKNTENGTTTTQKPDGSTVTTDTATGKVIEETKAPKQPDPDNEHEPLPEELQGQIDAELARLGQLTPRRQPDDGAEDPVDDDAAFGAGAGVGTGTMVDPKDRLLGGDTRGENDLSWGDSGGTNPFSGHTDPTPDADADPQTTGREEELFGDNGIPAGTRSGADEGSDDTDDTDDTGANPFARPIVSAPVDHVPDQVDDALIN